MASREHEAQEVVTHIVVQSCVETEDRALPLGLELVAEFLMLAFDPLVPAQEIDRSMLCGRHQPGAWIVRDARLGPLLERGGERVLCEFFGKADIAHDPRKAGDEPGRLDSPGGVYIVALILGVPATVVLVWFLLSTGC